MSQQDGRSLPLWTASVTLSGSVALSASKYPITWTRRDSDSGEDVQYCFEEPRSTNPPATPDFPLLEQQVRLNVWVAENRVHIVVTEALAEMAAVMAFAGGRTLAVSLPALRTESSEVVGNAPYKNIFLVGGRQTFRQPTLIPADILQRVFAALGDVDQERGRRVLRAMRWLARSRSAEDEIETFASLAIAYEALSSLLPVPSQAAAKSKKKRPKSPVASRLQYFAVTIAKIDSERWKIVGRLRHELFHGGIAENLATKKEMSGAIPALRRVVIMAIRFVLGLPSDIPQDNPIDELGIILGPISFTPRPKTGA